MPANTLNDMILGFSVILGILLIYIITLIIRTQHVKKTKQEKHP
jgi:competence protein ComGF